LPIANGGTNGTDAPTAGAVPYGTGTAYAFSAAGTTGQVLTSNGAGTPTWTTITSSSVSITDDTTTNATRYPLFANATSGTVSTQYTSSTKYQYNPSTGVLTATGFSGSGAALTSIPNSALTNSSVTIGSTAVALGATVTTFAGLTSVTSTTFVGALTGNASSATTATTATNATNIAITDNTSSGSTYYPVISSATTGNVGATTSSTKFSFVPSTGALTTTSLTPTNAVGVAYGGTGQTTYTDGQLLIGNSTGNTLTKATLTAGTGVTITNASGSITIASSGGGGSLTLSNDTTTSTNLYPLFANATSGTASTIYTGNAKLLYKPSTGELSASELVSTNGIIVNATSVSASYTIASGTNGFSVGPVTVVSGQSVTVTSGQRWVVI